MPRDKTGHFYYSWFPTIYRADTSHLTPAQDGAYRRLIDEYMLTRSPLRSDDISLSRIIGCDVNTWISEFKTHLVSFFKTSDGFWFHKFCDEVILNDSERIQKSRRNGSLGGRPTKYKINKKTHSVTETETLPTLNNTKLNKTKKESKVGVAVEIPTSPQQRNKIIFSYEEKKFSECEYLLETWRQAYPAVDIETELKRAAAWLCSNPKEKRSNYARFINTWLSREQDNGRKRVNGHGNEAKTPEERAQKQFDLMKERGLIV